MKKGICKRHMHMLEYLLCVMMLSHDKVISRVHPVHLMNVE